MNIVKCKMCRKPFHSLGGFTCPDCLRKIDEDFITVRDYIYDNPHCTIDKASEKTGVEKAVILHLLKEGRLTLDNPDADWVLVCEACKKPITSGRMCDQCKKDLAATMNKNIEGSKPQPQPQEKIDFQASKRNAKMHTDITKRK